MVNIEMNDTMNLHYKGVKPQVTARYDLYKLV